MSSVQSAPATPGVAANHPSGNAVGPLLPTAPAAARRGLKQRVREVVERPSYANLLATVTLLCTVSYFILSLSATKKGLHAQLFSTVYSEYSTQHMSECIAMLESFLAETGQEHYVKRFLEETNARTDLGRKLDQSRRVYQNWFSKIAHLHEFELLEDNYLQAFPGGYRAQRFLRLVEPLAIALAERNKRPVAPVFAYYRQLYNLPQLNDIISRYAHDEL